MIISWRGYGKSEALTKELTYMMFKFLEFILGGFVFCFIQQKFTVMCAGWVLWRIENEWEVYALALKKKI